jgi:hypothetical protein
MKRILLRRGNASDLQGANLSLGEAGFTIDTKKLYIGTGPDTPPALIGPVDLTEYATETYVDDAIAAVDIGDITFTGTTIGTPVNITSIDLDLTAGKDINLVTNKYTNGDGGASRLWKFGIDGTLVIPGTIVTYNNNDIHMDSSGHTFVDANYDSGYSIYLGGDHPTNSYVGGVIIGDHRGGYVNIQTKKLIVPNTVPPLNDYGAIGDIKGTIAFDDSYIYYCTSNYVDNQTPIWQSTPWSAATEDYVDTAISEISIPSISGLASETYVNNAISAIPDTGTITFDDNDITGNTIGQVGTIVSASTSSTGTTSSNSNALLLSSSIPNIGSVAVGWTVTFAGNITKNVVGITDISSEVKQIQFDGDAFVYNYPITITSPNYVAGSTPEVNIIAGDKQWKFDNDGELTFPDGTVQATAFNSQSSGQTTGTWTVPIGTSTHSFTVDWNNTYVMWVRGNIPNGITTWNATVSVTNANVPVIGTQYAWNYNSGTTEAPVFVLALTGIPTQIIGTPGAISTALPAVGTTSNTFAFTINNSSGAAQTISYGYTKI